LNPHAIYSTDLAIRPQSRRGEPRAASRF
jgi:hypothetical protein